MGQAEQKKKKKEKLGAHNFTEVYTEYNLLIRVFRLYTFVSNRVDG